MFTSYIKREIRRFNVVVVQWKSRKCVSTKNRGDAVVLIIKPIVFFLSRRCGGRRIVA